MALYPAIDVSNADGDLALAVVDDYSPSAAEERDGSLTIFFTTSSARTLARDALARAFPDARLSLRDVDDEDWARRSQENLTPVTVGQLTVAPPWAMPAVPGCVIVILPSMGFGTGHHATTRLCLAALQTVELSGASVLDVGTGSGVLAIASRRLGAAAALGIDVDPDAIASAHDNLLLNEGLGGVTFELQALHEFARRARPTRADRAPQPLTRAPWPNTFDVVLANLTGPLLVREASALSRLVRAGGLLILSGLTSDQKATVSDAFSVLPGATPVWDMHEDGWVGLILRLDHPSRGRHIV